MHELALVKNIVDLLEREVQSPDVGLVKTIHIEAGELRYIVPEIMNSCFTHTPKNEKLKNAKIELKVLPIKIKCRQCEKESVAEGRKLLCPECLSKEVNLISGNELNLKGIEW